MVLLNTGSANPTLGECPGVKAKAQEKLVISPAVNAAESVFFTEGALNIVFHGAPCYV